MLRHPALVPLSHCNQRGLGHALRLRRAATGDADLRSSVVRDALLYWRDEMPGHVHGEESILLPLLSRAGGPPEIVTRTLVEHERLATAMRRLAGDDPVGVPDPALMEDAGRILHDHIRFEERVLFDWLQRAQGDALDRDVRGAEARSVDPSRPGCGRTPARLGPA